MITLYHGTTEKILSKILKEGLKPRGKKKSNWDGFGTSRPDLVYLTNCYAPYYAFSACKGKNKAVVIKLKIDPKEIRLYPDEEFIFNCAGFKKEAEKTGKVQKIWNTINPKDFEMIFDRKERKESIGWKKSLEYLGTVTAEFIPKECIVGYYIEKGKLEFVMNCDPSISPLNYKFCGQRYKKYLENLNYKKVALT